MQVPQYSSAVAAVGGETRDGEILLQAIRRRTTGDDDKPVNARANVCFEGLATEILKDTIASILYMDYLQQENNYKLCALIH